MIRLHAHPPPPFRKLPLFLSLPVCRRSGILTGEGEGGGRGAESYNRKKVLPAINSSILSGEERLWQRAVRCRHIVAKAGTRVMGKWSHIQRQKKWSGLLYYLCSTLQRNFDLCIPRKGTVRPQSQYQHSCVWERFIYSLDRSTYFSCSRICRPIVGIYKSHAETWMYRD